MTAAEKIKDAYSRSSTLADIAKAQAAAGGIEEALATIETLEDVYRVGALATIAAAQTEYSHVRKAEDILATAMAIAEKIEDAPSRAWALATVARAQAENGDIGKAEEILAIAMTTTEKIEDAYFRVGTLVSITAAQAKNGNIKKAEEILATALTITGKIEGAYPRVQMLTHIAATQAGYGDVGVEETLAIALATAEEIESKTCRNLSLSDIAKAHIRAGRIEAALVIAEKIEYDHVRWNLVAAVAEATSEHGDFKKVAEFLAIALATAEGIKSGVYRDLKLIRIAEAQARAGHIEEAVAIVEKIETDVFRSSPLAEIAAAQARAGNFEEALAITEEIEMADDRIQAFVAIAKSRTKNGDARKAGEILAIALEATEKSENAERRTRALADIAEAQAKAGDIEGAFATATSIRNARFRAGAFARIAVAAADAN